MVVSFACWMAAAPAAGEELATAEQADALCSTAAPVTGRLSTVERRDDPLMAALRRNHYETSRIHRLLEVYRVTLDTQAYRFLPGEPGTLSVDSLQPFSLFGGTYAIDLGQTLDLAFTVSGEQADKVLSGYLADQVLLRLDFQLVSLEDPQASYCVSDEDGTVRIIGRLLAAELVTRLQGEALAHCETQQHLLRAIRLGVDGAGRLAVPRPRVLVTDIHFSTGSPPQGEPDLLRLEAETQVLRCYLQGLNLNGRLQGALVVSSRVDAQGRLSESVVNIDVLNQPLLTGCLLGALGEISLPRDRPVIPYDVRINFIFRLE